MDVTLDWPFGRQDAKDIAGLAVELDPDTTGPQKLDIEAEVCGQDPVSIFRTLWTRRRGALCGGLVVRHVGGRGGRRDGGSDGTRGGSSGKGRNGCGASCSDGRAELDIGDLSEATILEPNDQALDRVDGGSILRTLRRERRGESTDGIELCS